MNNNKHVLIDANQVLAIQQTNAFVAENEELNHYGALVLNALLNYGAYPSPLRGDPDKVRKALGLVAVANQFVVEEAERFELEPRAGHLVDEQASHSIMRVWMRDDLDRRIGELVDSDNSSPIESGNHLYWFGADPKVIRESLQRVTNGKYVIVPSLGGPGVIVIKKNWDGDEEEEKEEEVEENGVLVKRKIPYGVELRRDTKDKAGQLGLLVVVLGVLWTILL